MNKVLYCKCALSKILREAIPVKGLDFVNMIQVQLKPGENIRAHSHTEHTALYYPADSEAITIVPTAGMIIYMPPGTQHAVPKVTKERVSVAMLVQEES